MSEEQAPYEKPNVEDILTDDESISTAPGTTGGGGGGAET